MVILNRANGVAAIAASALLIAAVADAAQAAPAKPATATNSTAKAATGANAPYDPLAARYDNTVVVTAANGMETRFLFSKDGTVTVFRPDSVQKVAKWSRAPGQFCITPEAGAPHCGALGENPETLVITALAASPRAKPSGDQNTAKAAGNSAPDLPLSHPVPAKTVGDTWIMTLPNGDTATARIVPGR